MLKKRIIPILLFDDTMQVVKPVSFARPYRRLGTMMQYIRVLENRNVDELILVDITATEQNRAPNFKRLKEFTAHTFMPVTYGGGIRTLEDIKEALNSGADKVCIKTALNIIPKAAEKFGAQAIVLAMDYRDFGLQELVYQVEAEIFGVGEILFTNTEKDGTMGGYDLTEIREMCSAAKIPIIANGGAGHPEHLAQALDAGASAVAAGSMFLYSEWTPKLCAEYLAERGHAVRV